MSLKSGDGAATQHATRKQFGGGGGPANHPLKKSPVNPTQPNVDEAKAHAASKPKMAPQATAKEGSKDGRHTVTATNVSGAGRNSSSSRYTAPRGKESSDPMQCGYTKPGKM